MSVKIAASILSSDFTRLGSQVEEAIGAGADYIHVDVMDGHFVPNLTVGPMVVEALRRITRPAGIPLDVHLMVAHPEQLALDFVEAGADILTIHVEACPQLRSAIQQIKRLGVKVGVTLNPPTPLSSLAKVLDVVDQVLVMTVHPGFGGQDYLPGSTRKIARLRRMLRERLLERVDLEVDGGIKTSNAAEAVRAGATILVVGSAIFNEQGSVAENMATLRRAIGQ